MKSEIQRNGQPLRQVCAFSRQTAGKHYDSKKSGSLPKAVGRIRACSGGSSEKIAELQKAISEKDFKIAALTSEAESLQIVADDIKKEKHVLKR